MSHPKSTPKTILVAGLGIYVPKVHFPNQQNITLAEADMDKARSHGFDCKRIDLDPTDLPSTLASLRETLRSQRWDGLCIGYGVRGLREYTELFEGVVNAAVEEAPQGMKFLFATRPDGVWESVLRVFPLEA